MVTIDDYDLDNPISDTIKKRILKPFKIDDIESYILITELKNTNSDDDIQSLKLYCIPSIGTGKDHSKFNNISNATYIFHKDDAQFKEALKDEIKLKNISKKDESEFSFDFKLGSSERYYHRDNNSEPYWYDITIESFHYNNPVILYKQAINNLIYDLENCKTNFKLLISDEKESKFSVEKYKTNLFKFTLDQYDDTIGNILQTHIVNFVDIKNFIL